MEIGNDGIEPSAGLTGANAAVPGDRERGPITPEVLEALRNLDSSTLANAIENLQTRLRNEGFVDHTVQCFCPQLEPMVGYAATLRIRGSAPPTAGGLYREGTEWWDYVLSVPTPRVVVVQDVSSRPGLGSLIGVVHMNILRALDCAGVITNGAVRDLPAAQKANFHYFAGNLALSHTYVHIVEIGRPVEIGGLMIHSGDLLHGDLHGIQTIPQGVAERIPLEAAKVLAREKAIIALCGPLSFPWKSCARLSPNNDPSCRGGRQDDSVSMPEGPPHEP